MKIAIIGLGYVGLPLGLRFAESGVSVLGLDVDAAKVAALNGGTSYIKHIESAAIQAARESGHFEASFDFSRVAEVEAILLCVPTPLDIHREPDISYVLKSGEAIAPYLGSGRSDREDRGNSSSPISDLPSSSMPKLVVLESTTYPGTTDTELREVLEKGSGLKAGEGFHLAFSPEREDPGRKDHSVKTIPKIMGGYTPQCLDRCVELYSQALDQVHPVASCRVAEATKLTENIFRSVNIALVNELKVVFQKMDIDVWDVIDAAATKPFGFMPFYPGPGLGGHCIPIDPFYLTWKAREYEQHTRFIELAGEINTKMPDYVIDRVAEALNEDGKAVKGSRILILGLAYKPNLDDDRESPSYVLMKKLEERGAVVEYNDPFVPVIKHTRDHPQYAGRNSVEISGNYDCLLVATNHAEYTEFDFSGFTCPVVDARSCVRNRPEKYFKA
ncbi:nucleotide sugar dehydrogenase [Puniceicoccus vermicola]|uniref:Nucleotide sugar dehydrogenase n=1 Tax=Puniceicoccus vermicola TaxID=388746 RepID=A0A7X1AYI9_9BACT|nr:nucleotide sugar dehydrogenase [Puniceicoccus vermicola]MBC2601185.1 nucleotide sugar dehydrogenase [Puniceicoccus vermicola]